jgi:hypothetical protein
VPSVFKGLEIRCCRRPDDRFWNKLLL